MQPDDSTYLYSMNVLFSSNVSARSLRRRDEKVEDEKTAARPRERE